jgi:hypothetical protein
MRWKDGLLLQRYLSEEIHVHARRQQVEGEVGMLLWINRSGE